MSTTSRLKVGDRVRITRDIPPCGVTEGVEGVIAGVAGSGVPNRVQVRVDGDRICFFYGGDIELVAAHVIGEK